MVVKSMKMDDLPDRYPAHELLFDLLYFAIMERDSADYAHPVEKQTERRGLDDDD